MSFNNNKRYIAKKFMKGTMRWDRLANADQLLHRYDAICLFALCFHICTRFAYLF